MCVIDHLEHAEDRALVGRSIGKVGRSLGACPRMASRPWDASLEALLLHASLALSSPGLAFVTALPPPFLSQLHVSRLSWVTQEVMSTCQAGWIRNLIGTILLTMHRLVALPAARPSKETRSPDIAA